MTARLPGIYDEQEREQRKRRLTRLEASMLRSADRAPRAYLIPSGSGRAGDPRSWSRESGGQPGARVHSGVTLVLDKNSGGGLADLFGVSCRSVVVQGFSGEVRMPTGQTMNFGGRLPLLARLRGRLRPLLVGPLGEKGKRWPLFVRANMAKLIVVGALAVAVPVAAGGATIHASATGGPWSVPTTWDGGVVPGSADDVTMDGTSGNVTIIVAAACRSLTCTGYANTLTHNSGVNLSIGNAAGGALTFSAAMTYTRGSTTTSQILFVSTSNNSGLGWPITSAGKTITAPQFTGAGGRWQLQDSFLTTGNSTTPTHGIQVSANATLDTNSQAVSTNGLFRGDASSTVILGSSTVNLTSNLVVSVWLADPACNLSAANATIIIGSTSASHSFAGGSHTYGTFSCTTGTGNLAITGSNTFVTLTLQSTSAKTITFDASGVQNVTGNLTLTGASGQLLSIVSSSPGTSTRILQTSCSGSYTHAFTNPSADVVIGTAVCPAPSYVLPVEATFAATRTRNPQVESTQAASGTSLEPYESAVASSFSALAPLEALADAVRARGAPLESTGAVSLTAKEPLEATLTVALADALRLEALSAAAASVKDPLEATGSVETASLDPYESVVLGVAAYAVESLEGLDWIAAPVRVLPFETRGVPLRGRAVGTTGRTSSVTGTRGS